MKTSASFAALLLLFACGSLHARTHRIAQQEPKAPAADTKPAWPPALPKDVASLDAIVAAVYDVISGPAGERDWNRFRTLFVPDARLIPVQKKPEGGFTYHVMSVEDYVQRAGPFFKEKGFFESEVSRKTESFGQIASVFTTYESREVKDGKPFARGINNMQFFNDGTRWWCIGIYWDSERPDNPIPDRYLKK